MFLREIYFSSKWSSGHLECSFENPVKKVLTTSPKLPAQCLKMILEKYFFSKNWILKLFLWTRFMQLWPPFRKLSHKNPKVFLSISENDINLIFFQTNFLSSKLFLQTRIMQFWQPCQKKLCQKPENFALNFRKRKKITCLNKNLSKCCHGCVECSFDNPAENFLTKSLIFFAECPEMI